jgi:hypothetical protein
MPVTCVGCTAARSARRPMPRTCMFAVKNGLTTRIRSWMRWASDAGTLVGRLWAPGARRDGSADRSAIRAGRDEPAGFGKLLHSTIAGSRAGPIRYSPATPSVFRSEYGGVPKRKNPPSTRKGPPGWTPLDQGRSNKSRFMTLCHADTKSLTNFSSPSWLAYTSEIARSMGSAAKARSTRLAIPLTSPVHRSRPS